MARPTRILLVLGSGLPGGAELAALTLMRHAPPDVRVEALALTPGPMADRLRELGLGVHVGSLAGRPTARRAIGVQRALLRLFADAGPDVALAVGIKAAALAAPAARAAGVPLIWQKVDFSHDERLARPLALACAGVLPVSTAVAESIPHSRVVDVIPPPVRLPSDYRAPTMAAPPTVASVGTLVPYKGHQHVIEAVARLARDVPDLRAIVAGGSAPAAPGFERELIEVARRCGVAERVELTGHVERIQDVLDRSRVVVSATYRDEQGFGREGFGAALVEASWAGLPVVATSGGGTSEAVRDGITGTLVPPEQPDRLAAAVGRYLADPAAARTAGEAGAHFARERFQPAALAERLFAALRSTAR